MCASQDSKLHVANVRPRAPSRNHSLACAYGFCRDLLLLQFPGLLPVYALMIFGLAEGAGRHHIIAKRVT